VEALPGLGGLGGRSAIAPTIQAKLKIGEPNDKFEQEADRVADEAMRMPDPHTLERAAFSSSDSPNRIQRMCTNCEEELKRQPKLQAKGTSSITPEVTPVFASRIQSLQGGGQPLPASVRNFFEPRFGHDFSRVRVHSGRAAEQSARDVNAHAYTVGNNIVFGAGQFAPGTHEGQRLIAHELTHVVQQNDASQSGLQRSSVPTDLNCPNYEPSERSVSHREPGHLDPDVERLAPDKLLVADFGVDWRHIKGSTKSAPTLQAWLTAWESDSSYRLSIVGYSDCVGAEGLNTDLRHARASNVEALLGPEAKSRTTFRSMAALGNYVTDNSTPANRARNRGVIIEFHREFDEFPEEEIVVTPQHCGPDSTQWLVDQMNQNRNHPVIKTRREIEWPKWIPFFGLGWDYGALSDFGDLVTDEAPWDFKINQKQWRSDPGKTCPTAQCDKTVYLCGKCFFYDVPGNIHYGYIGRMASIRAWLLHAAADAKQKGGKDPADDAAAIDIGIAIADQGATLCGEIAAHENELNREGAKGCGLCPKIS